MRTLRLRRGASRSGRAREREQVRTLTRTFLARFFDNEITGGTADLEQSFIWLLAFLATPGIFFPFHMSFGWEYQVRIYGAEGLRILTRDTKTLYLGAGMIAAGAITAVVWGSLMVDRRDGIVLGTLPIRSGAVIRARMAAVAIYVALVVMAMHAPASLWFGLLAAYGNSLTFALRGVAAHFVAATLASGFVFSAVLAVKGVVAAVAGPQLFRRVSALLQLTLVTLIVLGFLMLPRIAGSVIDVLGSAEPTARSWILSTPPLWFLGLSELLLGTDDPRLVDLGRRAILATVVTAAIAALSYPLAARRVMTDAVERPDRAARIGQSAAPARWLVRFLARDDVVRATAQFFLATIGRVERHRLVLALAAGVSLAWAIPTLVRLAGVPEDVLRAPHRSLLALPLSTIMFLLMGLKTAASLPSDLRPTWIFAAASSTPAQVRTGLRRIMFAIAVLPVAAIAGGVCWYLYGFAAALGHVTVTVALGALVTEFLLVSVDTMPCAAPWRPERANLRVWWPAYLFAFVLLGGSAGCSISAYEAAALSSPYLTGLLAGVLIAVAILLRATAARRPAAQDDERPITADLFNLR